MDFTHKETNFYFTKLTSLNKQLNQLKITMNMNKNSSSWQESKRNDHRSQPALSLCLYSLIQTKDFSFISKFIQNLSLQDNLNRHIWVDFGQWNFKCQNRKVDLLWNLFRFLQLTKFLICVKSIGVFLNVIAKRIQTRALIRMNYSVLNLDCLI